MPRKDSLKLPESNSETSNPMTDSIKSSSVSPLRRFEKSMEINYEKWHDGIGYDLDAIKLASQTEREAIEQMLIHHSPRDWRDIEALAQIHTETARETIKNAIKDPNPAVRVAVTRYSPKLVTNSERNQSVIEALQHAKIFGGLSQVIDDIEVYHPAEVKEEFIKGLLSREGDVAALRSNVIRGDFEVIDVDYKIAVKSAELRCMHQMPMADSVIAATAQIHECPVFSDDAHFREVQNLKTKWC
jgi:predicted nucleic acid-binding protein